MKKILLSFLGAVLSFSVTASAYAFELPAQSYVVGHPNTDTIILEHNADAPVGPASLTKLMTLYLLFEAIENGQINMETELPISEKAWRMGGSKMFLEVGKQVKVENLIKGIAVSSGNDACIVVAEYLGGSEDGFARMMNDKAKALGMQTAHFTNASGWPDPAQVMSARDGYKLAKAIWNQYPQYRPYFSLESFTYNNIRQPNRNTLLRRDVDVKGMKTGHTEDSGYHLISVADRYDTPVISVVMGADSADIRINESLKALNYAYGRFSETDVVEQGQIVGEPVAVKEGVLPAVNVQATQDLTLFLPRHGKDVTTEVVVAASPVAPIAQGEVIANLQVTGPDGIRHMVPLAAVDQVARAGFFARSWRKTKEMIGL